MMDELQEIVEGSTKLLVPRLSLTEKVPPKSPAFFNPNARLNRDLSILAYRAYVEQADNRRMADMLAGVAARSIRAAAEVQKLEEVYINDANSIAVEIARKSSVLNGVENRCRFSVNEGCKFLAEYSSRVARFGIVDVDPFGTPAPYVDCALRAISNGGMLSVTATDTAVLCGIYPNVSMRRYYGRSINTEYGNEVGLRLLLGLLSMVASRLDLGIKPLFVHSTRNYLRAYVLVLYGGRHANEMPAKLGCIFHCFSCNNREHGNTSERMCANCKKPMKTAGKLWIDRIFDIEFVARMLGAMQGAAVDKKCGTLLSIAGEEAELPPAYFSVDRLAEGLHMAPPKMSVIITKLRDEGFAASRTSLNMTGFRTSASYQDVCNVLKALVA